MVKKVRLYKLQSGLEKWMQEDRELKDFVETENLECPEEYFIVQGKYGVLVSYRFEGVHWVFDDMNEKFAVGLWSKPEILPDGGKLYPMVALYQIEIPLWKIVQDCEYDEYDVADMVRKFGRRLDMNYAVLLNSLKEIGLDLSECEPPLADARGFLLH